MPNRASFRHDSGPRMPDTPGSTASAGSRTSVSTSSEVTDARSDTLRWISGAENPAVSVGTTKPRTAPSSGPSGSVVAHTIATSATDPLVIHIFEPFRIQSPEASTRAVVRIDDGSEPESGSVSPKQPIRSPAAMPGNHRCFCSSDPNAQIGNIASDPCTDTKLRAPESPASSSRHASP